MTDLLAPYGGYRRTFSFASACLVYHATEVFCARNYSYKNDPLGKTVGQMVGAARSARQNIVEGSSRAGTSKETELRLYDTAKASLEELAGDYEAFLVGRGELPWAVSRHDHAAYILAMRRRFAEFLEAEDPVTAANSLLLVIDQACKLLHRQMESVAETFREEGGFTERMSRAHLETRDAQAAASGVPKCPKCGRPMRKVIARKGRNAGQPFWGCTGYRECTGTRPYTQEGPET